MKKEKNMTENIADKEMSECKLCPRNCKKNRKNKEKTTFKNMLKNVL